VILFRALLFSELARNGAAMKITEWVHFRLVTISTLFLALSVQGAEPRREWQMVHDYVTVMDCDKATCDKLKMPHGQRINPFLSYTALGSDFGFIGPGQNSIRWEPGHVCVKVTGNQWGGMWHSLNRRGAQKDRWFDFAQPYPAFISAKFQPRVVGLRVRGKGHGKVDVEFKDADQNVLWRDIWEMDHDEDRDFIRSLPSLPKAKFLSWISEEGCEMCLDHVALQLEMPDVPKDLRIFLKSYAKLARCYSEQTGMVRDRAHGDEGAFDAMPATGMFCLATAVAARHEVVTSDFALQLLRRTHGIVSGIKTHKGLLPHFVSRREDGKYAIHPNTEFSSVDSALYFHSMLIAAEMLGDAETSADLLAQIRRIPFADLVDESGHVTHGFNENGVQLTAVWRDWGGETALVLLLQHLAVGKQLPLRMLEDGKVWLGTGFIPEIQSLLFPGFDSSGRDGVSGQNWSMIRAHHLQRQREYFKDSKGPLASCGVYGLSAGEGRGGVGYLVSGTELPDQTIVHPHYVLMSACQLGDTALAYSILESMEGHGLMPPWGLVENVDTVSGEMLPMLGSLNAAFETLGAYHLMVSHRKEKDAIYEAVHRHPDLTAALRMFYPEN